MTHVLPPPLAVARRRLPPAGAAVGASLALLLRCLCAQVRNAQLDKEASELRAENETLLRAAEEAKHSAVQSAQVPSGGVGSGGRGSGGDAQRTCSARICRH